MKKLVLDAAVLEKLKTFYEAVELTDATGKVVGVFQPRLYEPPISAEELDRLRNAPGGRPLGDILRDWGMSK